MLILAGVVLIALIAGAIAFARLWPFTEHALKRRLQQHSSATIEFGSFHKRFLPHPGFVAEHVVVRPTPSSPPSVTIDKLTVAATYSGLIGPHKSISLLKAEGLVLNVSRGGAAQNLEFHRGKKDEQLRLDHLVADGSMLQVSTGNGGRPLVFRISRLRMNNLGDRSSAGTFDLALLNPKPSMQIAAKGNIGPWRSDNTLRTPVTGSFSVHSGDLSGLPALHGMLTGDGQFKGNIGRVEVAGRADVADFELQGPRHPMPLRVQFDSVVNTSAAQVTLRSIDARLAATDIQGSGTVLAEKQKSPDFAEFVFHCEHGRVDDLLRLFTSSPQPSVVGPIRFRTTVNVERGTTPFLERVQLNGDFVINNAQFTSTITQHKLNRLSARSQGEPQEAAPPERAISLSSKVQMSEGVAHLSDTRFQVSGAYAQGGGTFNVLDKRVKLQGKLRMQAELSQSSTGAKSFFLKLLDPIFQKHGAGAEVPVYVTGTSHHAKFKAGLK